MDTPEILLEVLNKYAAEHADKKVLAIGCGDNYVKCLAVNKDKLAANVIAPYADYNFLSDLMDKEKFYELCEAHGIDYPKTYVCTAENYQTLTVPFDAPYILKPANQVEYYKHKFDGQKKVFKLDSFEEACRNREKVYQAGYTDHMITKIFCRATTPICAC